MEIVNQVLETTKEELNKDKNETLLETDISNDVNSYTAPQENEANNCLALTVKSEYRIVVFKNILKKSLKISWKIALSIITINFLNTFL